MLQAVGLLQIEIILGVGGAVGGGSTGRSTLGVGAGVVGAALWGAGVGTEMHNLFGPFHEHPSTLLHFGSDACVYDEQSVSIRCWSAKISGGPAG